MATNERVSSEVPWGTDNTTDGYYETQESSFSEDSRRSFPGDVPTIPELMVGEWPEYPRNIEGLVTVALQNFFHSDRLVANIHAQSSGTANSETVEQALTEARHRHTRSTNDRDELIRKQGFLGWDDDASEPVEFSELMEIESVSNSGDLVIQEFVPAYTSQAVLKHVPDDSSIIYHGLINQGDWNRGTSSMVGCSSESIGECVRDELETFGASKLDENLESSVSGEKIRGFLSTAWIATDTGLTHIDLMEQGVYRDVLRAMRGQYLGRDVAIPGRIETEANPFGMFIGYFAERWQLPFLMK